MTAQTEYVAILIDAPDNDAFLDAIIEQMRDLGVYERRIVLRLISCETAPVIATAPRVYAERFIERVSELLGLGDMVWQYIYLLPACHPATASAKR